MNLPLLRRFPRVRYRPASEPVIPVSGRTPYPALDEDFAVLDAQVAPVFERYDVEALDHQNRYRGQQVWILAGSALVSGLGGLQAVFPGQRWPSIALSAAAVLLGFYGRWVAQRGSLTTYLEARVKAERLRALMFRYLARVGSFSTDAPDETLAVAVRRIEDGKEAT